MLVETENLVSVEEFKKEFDKYLASTQQGHGPIAVAKNAFSSALTIMNWSSGRLSAGCCPRGRKGERFPTGQPGRESSSISAGPYAEHEPEDSEVNPLA
jgi:hypothetical protein